MQERRRTLLKTAGIALLSAVAGCAGGSDGGDGGSDGDGERSTPENGGTTAGTTTETPTGTVGSNEFDLVVNNLGARAWEVTEDESGGVAPLNEENPALEFEVGRRYAVENRGWSTHPFALRAVDDSPLLSQSADGRFEDDDGVDWTDDGGTFAFTFTDELAADADYYVCTVHPGMRGDVGTA